MISLAPYPRRSRTRPASILVAASLLAAPAAGAGQDGLPRPTALEPIGCAVCDGPEAFGAVRGLALFQDGGLVVLDRDEPMVRIFGSDGAPAGAFGRAGDGPGEMSWPIAVAATALDEILVADVRRLGLHRFTRSGEPGATIPLPAAALDVRADPTGRWVAAQVPDWRAMTGGVHLFDASGEAVGVPLETTAGVVVDDEGEPAPPGVFSAAPAPDGRLAVGHGSLYRIRVLDRSGRRAGELARDVERPLRTPEEIERLEEALRRGPPGRAEHPEAGAPSREVDPRHPHFGLDAFAWDERGRLWVRTTRGGPDATVFDLFDADGGYAGEVEVPVPTGHFAVGGDRLVAVSADPVTGVERVHRWRLR